MKQVRMNVNFAVGDDLDEELLSEVVEAAITTFYFTMILNI